MKRPKDREELREWVKLHVGVDVVGAGWEFLCWSFFEGEEEQRIGRAAHGQTCEGEAGTRIAGGESPVGESADCVVWACRGGGKTFLGALATALDLLFKPGIQVRLVAGSVEQGERMYEHLRRIFEHGRGVLALEGRITGRRVRLANGSEARLLAASQASVRGTRVHKIRVDEVDVIPEEVWKALQLTTVSGRCGEVEVRGSVQCFSTMHQVGGLMSRLVDEGGREVFKWGVVDVMENCGKERKCGSEEGGQEQQIGRAADGRACEGARGVKLAVLETSSLRASVAPPLCPLWNDCRGELKREGRRGGHVRIGDAIDQMRRVGPEQWGSEMVCVRPRRSGRVLEEFVREVHVVGESETAIQRESRAGEERPAAHGGSPCVAVSLTRGVAPHSLVCGMDFGWASPTVVLWAEVGVDGVLTVVGERVVRAAVMREHVGAITGSEFGRPAWVAIDPSGSRKNEHTGVSNAELLRAAGLNPKWKHMDVAPGLALVRARLMGADGLVRLRVHARCRELIRSLESYRWDPARRELEPLKDGSDHAVDALRYLVVGMDGGEGVRAGAYW